MNRIDFGTLVGLGVAEDAARGIVNSLSMRRMQAAESGIEIDDTLTLENLTDLGIGEEQARGLINSALNQRFQMQENAAATDMQRAAIAQAAAEADQMGAIRQDQRAQLAGRMEGIEANLGALNIARMAQAGQLTPGAEATDPEAELLRRQAAATAAAIAGGRDMQGRPLVAGAEATDSAELIALRQQNPGASAEQIQAIRTQRAEAEQRQEMLRTQRAEAEQRQEMLRKMGQLRSRQSAASGEVDSLYNQAALQAMMAASQPIGPRTFGEAMSGKPVTAQAEMQQNINLARQFFGRQGTVQRDRMKAAEAENRMRRFTAKQKQQREIEDARLTQRAQQAANRESTRKLVARNRNNLLRSIAGGKMNAAADRLSSLEDIQFAKLFIAEEGQKLARDLAADKTTRASLKERQGDLKLLLLTSNQNLTRISGEVKDAKNRVTQARYALQSNGRTPEGESALASAESNLDALQKERTRELAEQNDLRRSQKNLQSALFQNDSLNKRRKTQTAGSILKK
tara:strand:- start:1713 stop:3257 length:1545 start_codon:yes stop_codon:yes gene_type:complete